MKKPLCVILLCLAITSGLFPLSAIASSETDLFNKGINHLKSNQLEDAITAFSLLIVLSPKNTAAYRHRGEAYIRAEQFDLAIKDFEKARELQPHHSGLSSNLGVAWYYKKNYEKAIESYNLEIELFPDNHKAFFNRGLCHLELESYENALDDMKKALALKPDLLWAFCYKGDIFLKINKPLEAEKAYEAALALEPGHAYASKQLAALQTAYNRYHIQTGAFLQLRNAERQSRELLKRELDATVLTKVIKGKTYHIVKIGSFNSLPEAERTLNALQADTGLNAFIQKSSY